MFKKIIGPILGMFLVISFLVNSIGFFCGTISTGLSTCEDTSRLTYIFPGFKFGCYMAEPFER